MVHCPVMPLADDSAAVGSAFPTFDASGIPITLVNKNDRMMVRTSVL